MLVRPGKNRCAPVARKGSFCSIPHKRSEGSHPPRTGSGQGTVETARHADWRFRCAYAEARLCAYLLLARSAGLGGITLTMAKILVTGAAGFIGSNTCDALLAGGHEVVGVDNLRTGHAHNLALAKQSPRFRWHKCDVTEAAFGEIMCAEQPHAVLHLAALVSVPESIAHPELNHRLNVEGTTCVIQAASAAGTVRRIAFASSAAVYGDNPDLPLAETARTNPLSPYGTAKLHSESLLAAAAAASNGTLSTVALRYFNVFGPRQDPRSPYSGVISIFASALQEGRAIKIHGDGEQTRDFVSVADVARANLAALTQPLTGSIVANICTGRATSLNALLETMRRAGGYKSALVTRGEPRAGDIRHSLGSPAKARTQLGFVAMDDLSTGLIALFSATS